MCLLDEVMTWNANGVQCRSTTHRDPANPLRSHNRLGAVCAIEYAAQAMAVHGALIASRIKTSHKGTGVAGFLASVRNVTLFTTRLDDVKDDLIATAELVTGDERTVQYAFTIAAGERVLVAGRATIVFNTTPREIPASSRT